MKNKENQILEQFRLQREALLGQVAVDPAQLALELTELSDRLLRDLHQDDESSALIALGSYADRELTPNSDLDLLLLHKPRVHVDSLAQSIWYPLWDLGIKIDNSVRTPKEAIEVAVGDPRVLNGLCRPRLISGDPSLVREMEERLRHTWSKKRKSLITIMIGYARERHAESGELAFLLEPDLKDAKGGLRDFGVIKALELLENRDILGSGLLGFYDAQKTLQNTRAMLHLINPKSSNRLMLEDQDSVSTALGFRDADSLMEAVAQAGKTISFGFDSISRKLIHKTSQHNSGSLSLPKEFSVAGDEISISLPDGSRPTFPMLLELAVAAGTYELHISERTLEEFADANLHAPHQFNADEYLTFVTFLSLGRPMIEVAETLDHFRLLEVIIPEWRTVRSKPQRNAYHTYTVDRHLLEAVSRASSLRRRVKRPDLLLISALLHDIGKGFPGDHTEAGVSIVPRICKRFGMSEKDVSIVTILVQNHLTLADTATRRDISDPKTIERVCGFLKEPLVVEILEVLTEADSLATGTSAWSGWKSQLVSELVNNTLRAMEGLEPEEEPFPGDEFDDLIDKAGQGWAMDADSESLKLVAPDKPGLFALVTGTLALVGADIISARVAAKGTMATESFLLESPDRRPTDWNRFRRELQKSLDDPDSLSKRLSEKARNYSRARRRSGVKLVPPRVVVAPDASSRATVVEVWSPNRIGLLYDITSIIASMSLSIAHAKVLTLGDDVVDSFYITDPEGTPVSDSEKLADLSAALVDVLDNGPA